MRQWFCEFHRRCPFAAAMIVGLSALALVGCGGARWAGSDIVWPGPDGEPLPFVGDEILEFMRSARVESVKDLPVGITDPRLVVLEADGVRVKAVFHDHHVVRDNQRLQDGSTEQFFRDSYTNQVGAYELGRRLGMTNIPPTVLREIDGQEGSLQLWIENVLTETERVNEQIEFPDRQAAWRQMYDMDVFDLLINNIDRSQGNFLWGRDDWTLWLVDHSRAFGRGQQVPESPPVRQCSRRLWKALRGLDDAAIEESLGRFLSAEEIRAVAARRDELIIRLEQKIEEAGESEVLF